MIGKRLKEERERLLMSQTEFASVAGSSKRAIIDWEQDKTSPTAVQLSKLSGIGVDILYIITGQRTPGMNGMSESETQLISNYRVADDKAKYIIEQTSAAFVAAKNKEKSRTG